VVFAALAYWMAPSPQFKFPPKLATGWFVVGAMLANTVLCAMLFELTNGVMIISAGNVDPDTGGLMKFMTMVLIAQPFFAIALYPVLLGVIRRRMIPAVSN
jgi:hypothetical protein